MTTPSKTRRRSVSLVGVLVALLAVGALLLTGGGPDDRLPEAIPLALLGGLVVDGALVALGWRALSRRRTRRRSSRRSSRR